MQLRTSIHLLPVDTAESPPAVVHAPVSSPLFGLLQNNVWNVRYAVNIYFVRRLCKGRPCHDVATQAQGIEFAFGNGTYVQFVIVGGVHDPSYVFHWTLALIIDGVRPIIYDLECPFGIPCELATRVIPPPLRHSKNIHSPALSLTQCSVMYEANDMGMCLHVLSIIQYRNVYILSPRTR